LPSTTLFRSGWGRRRSTAATAGRRLSVVSSEPAPRRLPRSTYRRRRLVAAVVVAGLVIAAWAALGALGGALTASGRSVPSPRSAVPVAVVDVQPGDTIWSIARRVQPSGDVRPLVDRLAAAHGGTVLQVGERIVVPARR
jgi:LysM repeat protein